MKRNCYFKHRDILYYAEIRGKTVGLYVANNLHREINCINLGKLEERLRSGTWQEVEYEPNPIITSLLQNLSKI